MTFHDLTAAGKITYFNLCLLQVPNEAKVVPLMLALWARQIVKAEIEEVTSKPSYLTCPYFQQLQSQMQNISDTVESMISTGLQNLDQNTKDALLHDTYCFIPDINYLVIKGIFHILHEIFPDLRSTLLATLS